MSKIIEIFRDKVVKLHEVQGVTYTALARNLKISRPCLEAIIRKGKKLDAEIWERFKEIYG